MTYTTRFKTLSITNEHLNSYTISELRHAQNLGGRRRHRPNIIALTGFVIYYSGWYCMIVKQPLFSQFIKKKDKTQIYGTKNTFLMKQKYCIYNTVHDHYNRKLFLLSTITSQKNVYQ